MFDQESCADLASAFFDRKGVHNMQSDSHRSRSPKLRCSKRWVHGAMIALGCQVLAMNSFAAEQTACRPVTEQDFAFLDQPRIERQKSRIKLAGITTNCQANLVKDSISTIITTSIVRRLGPPFEGQLLGDGLFSAAAILQLNTDADISIPARTSRATQGSVARIQFNEIKGWEFPSSTEIIVTVTYSDKPADNSFVQRVSYKTVDGKRWYLDAVLKE